ncbi:phosphoglucosamine mutase [Coprothermobacteraceae bacterium]|nr:phosphoglucosamine mutase [Coprothermobacteraceae bacterium]
MPKLFGTDGIRGVSNKEITSELAFNLGKAVAVWLKAQDGNRKPLVAVAQDTRTSSSMLFTALSSGLMAYGADVLHFGVLPTPGLALLTRQFGANAAVMVSASHNPMADNGLKVLNAQGLKLSEADEELLESIMFEDKPRVEWQDIGGLQYVPNSNEIYGDIILERTQLALEELPVVVDVAHGATYAAAPYVLRKAGARVHVLYATPDGYWINNACGATNLESLKQVVQVLKVPIGFAFDGDGDRVLAVDKAGRVIDGDDIMAIIVQYLISKGLWDPKVVVGTVMTNGGLADFLAAAGGNLVRTKVGDKYVADAMQEHGAQLGGEPSGHIIYTPLNSTGDGVGIMAMLLKILAELRAEPNELLHGIVKKAQKTVNIPLERKMNEAFVEKYPELQEAVLQYERMGIRIVLRPSGTEPLLRLTVEGEEEQVQDVLDTLVRKVKDLIKE